MTAKTCIILNGLPSENTSPRLVSDLQSVKKNSSMFDTSQGVHHPAPVTEYSLVAGIHVPYKPLLGKGLPVDHSGKIPQSDQAPEGWREGGKPDNRVSRAPSSRYNQFLISCRVQINLCSKEKG